jgi:hypothetical protein
MGNKREILGISVRLVILSLFVIVQFTLLGHIIYGCATSDFSNTDDLFIIPQKVYIEMIVVISIIAIVTTIRIVISCIDLHNAIEDRKAFTQ